MNFSTIVKFFENDLKRVFYFLMLSLPSLNRGDNLKTRWLIQKKNRKSMTKARRKGKDVGNADINAPAVLSTISFWKRGWYEWRANS